MGNRIEIPESLKICETELILQNAKAMYHTVKSFNHVKFIDVYNRSDGWEFVVFQTRIQLPQSGIICDIKHTEIVAVGFDPLDEISPEVMILRDDFPSDLPHTNLKKDGHPKSLCLFDIPHDEVKLTLTPEILIERIRTWLRDAALGNLHKDSQFLEPFINDNDGVIILPSERLTSVVDVEVIGVIGDHRHVYKANIVELSGKEYALLPLSKGQPQIHGIFDYKPGELLSLKNFLVKAKINFIEELVNCLKVLRTNNFINVKPIFWVSLPKRESNSAKVEEWDNYCFLCENTAEEIGISIGLWGKINNEIGYILDFKCESVSVEALMPLNVKTLLPHFSFDKNIAKFSNKINLSKSIPKILSIGCGALGSQVFNNIIRQGYDHWTLVDDDNLFPHNIARHILTSSSVGRTKAYSLTEFGNDILNGSTKSESINILKQTSTTKVKNLLQEADIILDLSASVAAARSLAESNGHSKVISSFLNPNGTDLVIISEDKKRNHRLDYLEMIYYRELIRNQKLKSHLKLTAEKKYYARSCRDITFQIPQEYLSIHSGIAAGRLKELFERKEAAISIYTLDPSSYAVERLDVEISKVNYINKHGWSIYYDEKFLSKLRLHRSEKLPNETGGIIIGSYDIQRRKVYLVDIIPSPSDSEEYPYAYRRGIKGLDEQFTDIHLRTLGNLRYVGEWHSHPDECSVSPSDDDRIHFEWIRSILKNEGLPPLSLIVGEKNKYMIYIETMD